MVALAQSFVFTLLTAAVVFAVVLMVAGRARDIAAALTPAGRVPPRQRRGSCRCAA